MITFAAGLLLRIGDRTLAFERDLGGQQLQFKFQDNYQVVTFRTGALYTKILNREIHVVSQGGQKVCLPVDRKGTPVLSLPTTLSDKDAAQIDFRLNIVKTCLRMRIDRGSVEQIRRVLETMTAGAAQPMPSAWTARCWLKKYAQSGGNAASLLDRRAFARHPRRLNTILEGMINDGISRWYMQFRGDTARETCRKIRLEVRARNRREGSTIPEPSESTVARRINEVDHYLRDYKRLGPAFTRNKWRYSLAGDTSTRVLQRVEVDHTLLDLWVLDPRSGIPVGRPWVTVLLDRFSGYILGFHVGFAGPSVGSVAAAIKNAILPKDSVLEAAQLEIDAWTAMGVAELYVVDNGLEFHSTAFKRLAWHLRADLLFNPVRQPWLKSGIERCLMEACRILPARGKVYAPQKNVKAADPRDGAAVMFDDLCRGLLLWAADLFPKQIHPKTLVRPLDLWEEGRLSTPLPMFPLDLSAFSIISGVALKRTVDGDGVQFQYLRYNCLELQDYIRRGRGKFRTEIRIDPDDLSYLHVLLPNVKQWLAVPMVRPSLAYGEGMSLLQHMMIRQQAKDVLTRANAYEELERSRQRMAEFWSEVISRGAVTRKDRNLVAFQNLTSARVFSGGPEPLRASPPEASDSIREAMEDAVPFASFSLEEECL